MKIFFFLSASLIVLLSCKSEKDVLYGKCSKHYFECNQILLKNNGEFEFFQFYDVGGSSIVKGSWAKKKDTIILNTYEQQENRIDSVSEIINPSEKDYKIIFQNRFWGSIEMDSIKYNVDNSKQTLIFNNPFQKIIFNFFNIDGSPIPVSYRVKNPNANNLIIRIKQLSTSTILKDYKFIKKTNKLIYIDKTFTKKKMSMKDKKW